MLCPIGLHWQGDNMGEYQDVLQDMWEKTYRTQDMVVIL